MNPNQNLENILSTVDAMLACIQPAAEPLSAKDDMEIRLRVCEVLLLKALVLEVMSERTLAQGDQGSK